MHAVAANSAAAISEHINAKYQKNPSEAPPLLIKTSTMMITPNTSINGHISADELANDQSIIGFVHIPSVIIISLFGFMMAPFGVKMSTKLPVKVLKKIFAILLVCLSIKMLMNVVF